MPSTLVADPDTAFEFNPSAPEFVPINDYSGPVPCDMAAMLPQTILASNLSPHGPGRGSFTRRGRAQTCDDNALMGEEGTSNQRRPRRSTARRPTGSSLSGSMIGGMGSLSLASDASAGVGTAAPAAATLVVKNLALHMDKDDIVTFLEEKGVPMPQEVELHLDASGSFRGTAFMRYTSPDEAKTTLETLGHCPELGGRKARIEFQKAKGRDGRRSLEAELPEEELGIVREEIERFLADPVSSEIGLPGDFTVHQRKYAHSLAERHNLVHVTQQGDSGEKYVFLSKARKLSATGATQKAHSVSFTGPGGAPELSPAMSPQSLPVHHNLLMSPMPGMMGMSAYPGRFKRGSKVSSMKAHSFQNIASPGSSTMEDMLCFSPGLTPMSLPVPAAPGLSLDWTGMAKDAKDSTSPVAPSGLGLNQGISRGLPLHQVPRPGDAASHGVLAGVVGTYLESVQGRHAGLLPPSLWNGDLDDDGDHAASAMASAALAAEAAHAAAQSAHQVSQLQ